jgi:hypothetical protein
MRRGALSENPFTGTGIDLSGDMVMDSALAVAF